MILAQTIIIDSYFQHRPSLFEAEQDIEKKYPYDCFVVSSIHSVIMAETQQPIIVIIWIIYSPYLSKDLVELRNIFQAE